MASLFKKKTIVDRKLEALQKESEKIRNTIKVLDKAIQRSDESVLSEWPSSHAERPSFREVARPSEPSSPEKESIQTSHRYVPPEAAPPAISRPTPLKGRRPEPMDHKFASYLTSGSFVPASPLREDRSVQRNKAIFMVVFVGVFAFIIYSLVRHF